MVILYYGQFEHFSYCENWIADALDRGGHNCIRVARTKWFDESRLLTVARHHDAKVLLLSKTPEIRSEHLKAIRAAGLKVVFWTFDWMRHPDAWAWYGPLAKEADICFQTDGHGEAIYGDEGINRIELHQACVPGLHDIPDPNQFFAPANLVGDHYGADVLFVGSEYTERRRELVKFLSKYPGFQKNGDPAPQLWGAHFARAVYLSKIVVGDNFVNGVPGYWSDRVYLTLGCGGFFLTAYVEGLERLFQNHQHLVWWKSFEELDELIQYYLPRESSRRAIALAGHDLVHQRDTYAERIRVFTEALRRL